MLILMPLLSAYTQGYAKNGNRYYRWQPGKVLPVLPGIFIDDNLSFVKDLPFYV
jgi:hypothetical protein